MMEDDDKADNVVMDKELTHAEMRAMLWGRQRQETLNSEHSTPGDSDSRKESSSKRASRPTSLSEEWEELSRIKSDENLQRKNSFPELRLNTKRSIWKNFLALCTGLMFAFISFLPLRNIQTSLYDKDYLGNISLVCVYFCFMIGCVISPWLVQNAKPKGLLLLAMISHVFYVAANLLPSFMTLLPASCLFGFLQAPLWSVQELLLGSYGTSYSSITNIRIEKSIRQFQSIFLVFCHSAQIIGNLLQSGILNMDLNNQVPIKHFGNQSHDECVNVSCHHAMFMSHARFGQRIIRDVKKETVHYRIDYLQVLLFVYLALACLSMTMIGLCLKKPDIIINKRKSCLKEKLADICEFMKSKLFFSTFLLMIFTGMQQALVIGDITKVYGTQTLGIGMVGYAMMCYGTAQLATLLIIEKIQRKFKPVVLVLKGFLITEGLSYLLVTWEPSNDSIYKILGFLAAWGAMDALWQSQVQGILLSAAIKKEPAVVCFRVCQGLGLSILFLSALWLSLLYKVCLVGATLMMGYISYLIMEVSNNPITPLEPRPFNV